jgi:hypothetical protein
MSQQLINRSSDLKHLRDEGYDVEIRSNYLVVKNVPYVNSKQEIKFGTLISELTLTGDITTRPSTHVVMFAGEFPCHIDGTEMIQIKSSPVHEIIDENLCAEHSFSSKPKNGYTDYYEKITTYATIISSPAQSLDPKITVRTFPVIESEENESVFNYIDTASSRAGINKITKKLELGRIAIVGVGGTGSYVLDLIAKTPIKEIHLFDGDKFLQHNAFRSPGAPSLEELRSEPQKVAYLKERYSNMHRYITANDFYIDASNVDQLRGMDFVFLCLDDGDAKKLIVDKLEEFRISFIDVGMGISFVDDSLLGILRVTSSTDRKRDHVKEKKRIPFSDGNRSNDYAKNIQIADLNALNAALAVIKWKKLCGFYHDLEDEHFSTYTIDGNVLTNEDRP